MVDKKDRPPDAVTAEAFADEAKAKRKPRKCLACSVMFDSLSVSNRICQKCKEQLIFRESGISECVLFIPKTKRY